MYKRRLDNRILVVNSSEFKEILGPRKRACVHPANNPKKSKKRTHWAVVKDSKTGKALFMIQKQIGCKTSMDGEVHKICLIKKESKQVYSCKSLLGIDMAIKLVPAGDHNPRSLSITPWKENHFSYFVSIIMRQKISPHFTLYYTNFVCDSANEEMFKNRNIIKRYKNKKVTTELLENIIAIEKNVDNLQIKDNQKEELITEFQKLKKGIAKIHKPKYGNIMLLMITEMADQDLSSYLRSLDSIGYDEVVTLSFYILQAISCMHRCINLVHMDLHLCNLLIKYRDNDYKEKYDTYIIDKVTYHVPQISYDVWITDFGRSEILTKTDSEKLAIEAKLQHNFLFNPEKTTEFYNRVHHNLNRNFKYYREFFKSFDTLRVFTELYYAIRDIAEPDSIDFVRSIAREGRVDFLVNMASLRKIPPKNPIPRRHYHGHPQFILENYYKKEEIFLEPIEDLKIDTEFVLNDKSINKYKTGMKKFIKYGNLN